MVGFAGETDEKYKKSLDFVQSIGFAKVHIFPYSRRKGTAADRYPNQLSPEIKKARAAEMARAANITSQKFLHSQIGKTEQVLIETRNKNGRYEGYTMNYTPVLVDTDETNINKIVNVFIEDVDGEYCIGKIV